MTTLYTALPGKSIFTIIYEHGPVATTLRMYSSMEREDYVDFKELIDLIANGGLNEDQCSVSANGNNAMFSTKRFHVLVSYKGTLPTDTTLNEIGQRAWNINRENGFGFLSYLKTSPELKRFFN